MSRPITIFGREFDMWDNGDSDHHLPARLRRLRPRRGLIMTMRIISSTLRTDAVRSGELDADAAAHLCGAIDEAVRYATRESYTADEIGQKIYHTACGQYEMDGVRRWWLLSADPNEIEYSDCGSGDEVQSQYEDTVRQLNGCVEGQYFEYSDVDGR